MDLTGHHSNPPRPLEALLDRRIERRAERAGDEGRALAGAAVEARAPIASRHRRHDWVLEAVLGVLAERKEPMRARDVHSAVRLFWANR